MTVFLSNNVASIISHNYLTINNDAYVKTTEQLSSGNKYTKISDNAAVVSMSVNLGVLINGNTQALTNIQTGKNLLSVAEQGETAVTQDLQRMIDLCVQALNGTYSDSNKDGILEEIQQRIEDINSIAGSTNFLGQTLLDGSKTTLPLQVGTGSFQSTNTIDVAGGLTNVYASVIGGPPTGAGEPKGILLPTGITGATWTSDKIKTYLDKLNTALSTMTTGLASVGSFGKRLDSASSSLTSMNESLQSTRSDISDIDVAETSADMIKYQILQQVSTSIISQADQMKSLSLGLLDVAGAKSA